MTVMVAVGGGASQRIQTEMRNLGANTIVLNSGALKSGGVSRGQGSRPSSRSPTRRPSRTKSRLWSQPRRSTTSRGCN